MRRVSAGRSSAPPSCIGVTIATRLPFSIEHHPKRRHFTPKRHSKSQSSLRERRPPPPPPGHPRGSLGHRGPHARPAPLLLSDDRERFDRARQQLTPLEQHD